MTISKPKKRKTSVRRRNPTSNELKLLESTISNQSNKVLIMLVRDTLSLHLYGKLVSIHDRFGLVVDDNSSSIVFSLEDIAKVYMTPKKIVEIVIV